MKTAIATLLIALSLPLAPAWAQDRINMHAAVEQALAANPQVRTADRQIDAARAREVQAGALPNPNLSLEANEIQVGSPTNGSYMAGIHQPLLLGGQKSARVEAARLDVQLAEFNRETVRRELAAQVKGAYIQTLYEMAGEQLAQANAESAATMLKAVQARYKAGEVPQVEVLQAEVENSRAQRDVEVARSRVLQARAQLNVLMGRAAQAPIAVQDLPAPTTSLPDLTSLVRQALESRVELKQAEASIQRETLQRRVAQTGLWTGTEVSLALGTSDGLPAISGSLAVPIPIYRQQGEVAEAEANRQRAEAERDALRNEITLNVEQAYREAFIAAKQAILFANTYLPQADRLLDNAQRRFQAGEGSGLEVIEARRAVRETRTEYQRALLDYRRAIASLERAIGQDLPQ